MTNEMNVRINFKKIAFLSLVLGAAILLIKNLITYLFFRKTGIEIFTALELNGASLIAYSFFYYYIHAFVLFSVFVYIRRSLPDEYKKAGLIFALISFLLGDTIYSVLKIINDLNSGSLFLFANNYSTFSAVELISSIISLISIGFLMSYTFEKFYKK